MTTTLAPPLQTMPPPLAPPAQIRPPAVSDQDGVGPALEAVAYGVELSPCQAFALLQAVRKQDRRVLEALPIRKTASPIDLRLGTCYVVSRAFAAGAGAGKQPERNFREEQRECTPVTFQSVLNSYVHWSADAPELGVAVCAMSRARRRTTARYPGQQADNKRKGPLYDDPDGNAPGPSPGTTASGEPSHGLRGRMYKLVTKGRDANSSGAGGGPRRARDLSQIDTSSNQLLEGSPVRGEPCEAIEGATIVQVFPSGISALVGAAALVAQEMASLAAPKPPPEANERLPPNKRHRPGVARGPPAAPAPPVGPQAESARAPPEDDYQRRLFLRGADEGDDEANDVDRLLSHCYGTKYVRSGTCAFSREAYVRFYRGVYGARPASDEACFERLVWVSTRRADEPEFRQYVDRAPSLKRAFYGLDVGAVANMTREDLELAVRCLRADTTPRAWDRLGFIVDNARATRALDGGLIRFVEVTLASCRESDASARVAADVLTRAGFSGFDETNVATLADLIGA